MQIVVLIAGLVVFALAMRALAMRGETSRPAPAHPVSAPLTEDPVRELLLRGRKIEAIKAYRGLHDVNLMDAKRAVERLAEQLPRTR